MPLSINADDIDRYWNEVAHLATELKRCSAEDAAGEARYLVSASEWLRNYQACFFVLLVSPNRQAIDRYLPNGSSARLTCWQRVRELALYAMAEDVLREAQGRPRGRTEEPVARVSAAMEDAPY